MTRITLALALLVSTTVLAGPAGPPVLRLQVGDFDPLARAPRLPEHLRWEQEPASGYFIVQLDRPITPTLLERLRREGAETIHYLPERSYVVRLAPGAAGRLRALPDVRWVGPIQPGWKLAPDLGRRAGGRIRAAVELFPGEDLQAAALEAESIGATVLDRSSFGETRRLELEATRGQLERLGRLPAVSWIEEVGEITLRNNTARWVVQTNVSNSTTVWDMGLHGEGQIIGHIDGLLDINSCYFMDSVDNTPGPSHRKIVGYRPSGGVDSHGTHTAGTAAGDQVGGSSGDGHAYAAKLTHTSLGLVTTTNVYTRLEEAYNDGARTHTNSWGDDGTTAYTTLVRDIDLYSYDYEDALVVHSATNQTTLRTPENAKNLLAVGASWNGVGADNFWAGGSGPTYDGRRKPEIYAPGRAIASASTSSCSTVTQSGTSMAAPAVAGAAALVRQYFEEGWYPTGTRQPADAFTPSGALVKAVLLNSAVDMAGLAGFPGDQEGWGRVLLENGLDFAGDTRKLVVLEHLFNAAGLVTGEAAGYALTVDNDVEDLKLTLVFTEPAAALMASAATVNNLDLEAISPSGTVYRGNWFGGGVSVSGGLADPINNVEQILIPAPETGDWIVTVDGTAVNQGTQGFALVATGEISEPISADLFLAGNQVLDSPPLGNNDGVADPGETIVLPLSLLNPGTATATSVATQLASAPADPARVTDPAAAYPNIDAHRVGDSLSPHHQVTVEPDAACGVAIRLDVGISDSSGSGATTLDLPIGRPELSLAAADVPQTGDGSTWTVTSTINVALSFVPTSVTATVEIDADDIGEIVVDLSSPNTTVTLHNQSGAGGTTISGTYGAGLTPDGPGEMSDFHGEQAQGNWTLTVSDVVNPGGPSPGTLQSWSLFFLGDGLPSNCTPLSCGGDPVPPEVNVPFIVTRENVTDLRFDWPAVPGAAGYRIWRSPTADFAQEQLLGTTATNTFLESGTGATALTRFYKVRAVNSCEWEGP